MVAIHLITTGSSTPRIKPLKARMYASMDDACRAGWREVHESVGDIFSDPRFIAVVEKTLGTQTPCSPVVVFDDQRPVAITVISRFRMDATILAPDWHQAIADRIRRLWPDYLFFSIVFCGLPTLISPRTLWVDPKIGVDRVVAALAPLLEEVARSNGAHLISFGDIDDEENCHYRNLKSCGFRQLPAIPANRMVTTHADLREYTEALRQGYRYSLRKDVNQFAETGWEIQHDFNNWRLPELITDHLYAHYLQLMARSPLRTIVLPREFFRELARVHGRNMHLIRLMAGERCMGFLISLLEAGIYYPLFAAVDDEKKKQNALYRIMFFEALDFAMKKGASLIELGGTADHFKNRLGCHQVSRSVHVKVRGILGLGFRLCIPLFSHRSTLIEPAHIFKGPSTTPSPSCVRQPELH